MTKHYADTAVVEPLENSRRRRAEVLGDVSHEQRVHRRTRIDRIRRAAVDPDACLHADRSTARWLIETEVDVEEFEALAARGWQRTEEQALTLYRGDFLEGDYDDWPSAQRAALANVFEDLLARSVRDSGDAAAARGLLERNPYDENAHARLIESDLRVDRAAAAVRLQRYRDTLRAIGDALSREFGERFAGLERAAPSRSELGLAFAGRSAN